MNSAHASTQTKIKVGFFTILGLLAIGAITVFVNDKPQWWKPCQFVTINIDDATGLKERSGVRSLGLEIGYLKSVILSESHVELGICITEDVEVLPTTRAYIRSEGFLGDKFVELKPVKYLGRGSKIQSLLDALIPSAYAQNPDPQPTDRQIPVGEEGQDIQNLVKRVDSLVGEMTKLTNNLRDAINPEELRSTMRQLNRTLENASKTLAPEGGLNQTAQRTLGKLEDSIEQLRDMMVRVNQGEGSLGMLLNDPAYAEEIREILKNANKFLNRAAEIRMNVDIGGQIIQGHDSSRGWFQLQIWPTSTRYYLLALSFDPRGARTVTTTTTETPAGTTTSTTEQIEETAFLVSAMFGKVFFRRLDLSVGARHGDGAASLGLYVGPQGMENRAELRGDLYTRAGNIDGRTFLTLRPYSTIYVQGGIESFRKVNGETAFMIGGGVSFDDEDIKLLFTFAR